MNDTQDTPNTPTYLDAIVSLADALTTVRQSCADLAPMLSTVHTGVLTDQAILTGLFGSDTGKLMTVVRCAVAYVRRRRTAEFGSTDEIQVHLGALEQAVDALVTEG